MNQSNLSNFNVDFDPKLLWLIARRNLVWIFLIISASMVCGYFYLRYTIPLYETSTKLKLSIEDNANKVLNIKSNYVIGEKNNNIASAVEVIRSKIIMQRVVNALPLKVSYYNRGRVVNFESYRGAPIVVAAYLKNNNYYGIPFYIEADAEGYLQLFVNKEPVSNRTLPGGWMITTYGNFKITLKDTLYGMDRVKENKIFFIVNDPSSLANVYTKQVSVDLLDGDAQTILIKAKDNNPEKAADIANTIAREYILYDLNKLQAGADSILVFIERQLSTVDVDLRDVENNLENFKKNNKIYKSDKDISATLTAVNDLRTESMKYDAELDVLDKILKNITQNKDINSLIPLLSQSNNNVTITTLINNIQSLNEENERLMRQATPKNEYLKNINAKIDQLKKQLFESIDLTQKTLLQKKKMISLKISDINNELSAIPNTESEYNKLERLFNIHEKFYSLLLEKKAEFLITKAGLVSNNLILEDAGVPTSPVYPLRFNIFIISFGIGIVLSVFLIALRYVLHNEITSIEDIKPYVNIPILGIVPLYRADIPVSELIVDRNPKSSISEAFRSIRSNLQFISNQPGFKLITITSTISGEGKTFVAINLGGVMAFSGKRVIVLDLDMRKPKIHVGFGVANDKGISTILIGKDSPENCIHHSSLENLDFITAGPIPPNPAELIINPTMDDLIAQLKTLYDVIIIDTPPIGLVTDGVPLIQRADYPIYVVRSHYSKKAFLNNIIALNSENHISRLSLVLNGMEMQNKYGFGYGYNYGYGYGYGGYYEDAPHTHKSFFNVFGK